MLLVEVIHDAGVRREFARHRVAGIVLVPAHASAQHQRQRIGQAQARARIHAALLGDAGRAPLRVVDDGARHAARIPVVRVKHGRGRAPAVRGPAAIAVFRRTAVAGADGQLVLAAEQAVAAAGVRVVAGVGQFGAVALRIEAQGVAAAVDAGKRGVDLGRLARGGQLGLPAVAETVFQFGEDGLVRLAPFIEIGAQVGRAGQVQESAIGRRDHARRHAIVVRLAVVGAHGQRGVGTQVRFDDAVQLVIAAMQHVDKILLVLQRDDDAPAQGLRCVERVGRVRFQPVVAPAAHAGRERGLRRGRRALAHQVDGRAGRAAARRQARGAAHHFDAVVDGQVVVVAIESAVRTEAGGQAVEQDVIDGEAARAEAARVAREVALLHDQSRDRLHGVVQRRDAQVVDLLARQHADRLRRFAQRQVQLGCRVAHARRIGAAAFRRRIAPRRDGDAGHGLLGRRAGWRGLLRQRRQAGGQAQGRGGLRQRTQ